VIAISLVVKKVTILEPVVYEIILPMDQSFKHKNNV
jgi:hypothetical protein